MEKYSLTKNRYNSFSMREIPYSHSNNEAEYMDNDKIDKVKIIELSNLIDKWEQEILFSEDGFYSIKGRDIKDKLQDYIKELELFINEKISEISFENESSKSIALKIKQDKIAIIKNKMSAYYQEQLCIWEQEVYDNAISFSILRAVYYKSDNNIVFSSLKNGLSVLKFISEKENWNDNIYKEKISEYKSQFFSSLINSYIDEKDITAYLIFNKYKKELNSQSIEEFEKTLNILKQNIIAYNWVNEVISFNVSKEDQEKLLKEINDDEITKLAKQFLSNASALNKKNSDEQVREKNKKNWQQILQFTDDDINKAYLYIDFSLNNESIKSKKEYIKKIRTKGYIETDKEQFINLLIDFFENFESFKTKDISDYISIFSTLDYEIIDNLQKIERYEFESISFDYKYLKNKLEELNIQSVEDKYDFIKLYLSSKDEYKEINKKNIDIENRTKLIDLIAERIKQYSKKEERNNKDDGIINIAGE